MKLEFIEARSYLAAHIAGSTSTYATIQAAVNAAAAGSIISVDAGTYNETVSIYKSLTIRGAQAGADARNARGAESIVFARQTVFDVYANDVTIDGFTIQGNRADIGAQLGAGVLMRPSIHGTHVLNNVVQNNVTGIYLSNDSNTDAAIIQHNLIQNNFEANNYWTKNPGENGSRGIYTDGTVSGGYLTNALIDSNRLFNSDFNGGDEDMGMISLQALTAGKQFNITITNNYIGNESKALLATNVTNLVFMGNTCTGLNDGPSGPVRFEGNSNVVNIQYNTITGNAGPGVAVDSSGVSGDSSGFVVNNNNIYGNNSRIGLIVTADVYNGPLTALGNWWGSATGPGGLGSGTGSQVWGNGKTGHGVNATGLAGGGPVYFSPWASSLINITNIPAPAAPATLSMSALTSTSILLNWTAPMSTATSQWVQRSTDGVNFVTVATVPPLLNSYTDTVAAGGTYSYRVVAANSTGNSAPSNIVGVVPPSAPLGLSAAALSTSQIKLSWTAPTNPPSAFILQRSTDNVNFTTISGSIAGTATSYTDAAGLSAGTKYYYRLYATNAIGTSPASATASATTVAANAVTTAISSLAWTSATSGYLTVQKNASIVGNTIGLRGTTYASGLGTHAASTVVYNLAGKYSNFLSDVGVDDEVSAASSAAVQFKVYGDGVLLYDSGVLTRSSPIASVSVALNGVQTLTLVATNGVAGSIDFDHADWAGARLLAAAQPPAAPAGVTAVALTTSSIKLAWSASTGATGYAIERSLDGTTWSPLASVGATVLTYTNTGLTANTTYSYRVRATSVSGDSANSAVASAKTLSAASVTTNLSGLNWTSATAGYGTVRKNTSTAGNPINLGGVAYASGIGTHASSTIVYNLGGTYTTFQSDVGFDNEVAGRGSDAVVFQVIGDGKVLFTSAAMTDASPAVGLSVDVTGVQTLTLTANAVVAGNIDYAHVDWAGARLISATAPAPTAPTGLTAAATSTSQIKLAWTNTAPAATGLLVQRSGDGVTFATVATLGATATTYTDAGLTAGTTYTYQVLAVTSGVNSPASARASATTLSATAVTTALSSLTWTSATSGWGSVQNDATVAGNGISLRGTAYASGVGAHAASTIVYNLAGKYQSFLSDVGVDDEVKGTGSVRFQVLGDGVLLYDSGVLTNASPIASLNVNVSGVQTLTLVAASVDGDIDFAHADWAGARLSSAPAAPVTLTAATVQTPAVSGTTSTATRTLAPTATPTTTTWKTAAVGTQGIVGGLASGTNKMTVSGAGTGIGGKADGFFFAYRSYTGDFSLTALVDASQAGKNQAGLMVRNSTAGGSRMVSAVLGGHQVSLAQRTTAGAATTAKVTTIASVPQWLKLVRRGNVFTESTSTDGKSWTTLTSTTVAVSKTALIGMAVSSGNTTSRSSAFFSQVAITA